MGVPSSQKAAMPDKKDNVMRKVMSTSSSISPSASLVTGLPRPFACCSSSATRPLWRTSLATLCVPSVSAVTRRSHATLPCVAIRPWTSLSVASRLLTTRSAPSTSAHLATSVRCQRAYRSWPEVRSSDRYLRYGLLHCPQACGLQRAKEEGQARKDGSAAPCHQGGCHGVGQADLQRRHPSVSKKNTSVSSVRSMACYCRGCLNPPAPKKK